MPWRCCTISGVIRPEVRLDSVNQHHGQFARLHQEGGAPQVVGVGKPLSLFSSARARASSDWAQPFRQRAENASKSSLSRPTHAANRNAAGAAPRTGRGTRMRIAK